KPINELPNPYTTVRDWGELPDDRKWGFVSAIHVDIDGEHIWAGDRCGDNSCIGSKGDPIVKLDSNGKVVKSFGVGLIDWPDFMVVVSEGNLWVLDSRGPRPNELKVFPESKKLVHQVIKFCPEGEELMF